MMSLVWAQFSVPPLQRLLDVTGRVSSELSCVNTRGCPLHGDTVEPPCVKLPCCLVACHLSGSQPPHPLRGQGLTKGD